MFFYLAIAKMTKRWEGPVKSFQDGLPTYVAGITACLFAGFSFSFWENALEAEVYATNMLVMASSLWLILRWSEIREEPRFNTDFKSTPGGSVAYHAPCHLRAQAVGFKGRDLLRKIPGVKPRITMECCGHDGTYAMKVEGFDPSRRIGQKAFTGMKAASAEVWATDCPLAALQFQQHAGKKPMHPMSILARAYREDGFPDRVPDQGGATT